MSKRTQQFVKFVCCFLIRNCAALLWFVRKVPGYGIEAVFAKHATIFAKRTAFSQQKASQSGKRRHNPWNAALYKTVHCDAAINLNDKVRCFWWEKSGAHTAMFSSAAAACLLHSFCRMPYTTTCVYCAVRRLQYYPPLPQLELPPQD